MMTHCPEHCLMVIQERATVYQVNESNENIVPKSITYLRRLMVGERYVNRRELDRFIFSGKH